MRNDFFGGLVELKLLGGNANPVLARKISEELGVGLCDSTVGRFSDGEVTVKINESVRGVDIFVIQPLCRPVNESLVELLVILDALKRASPSRITAVVPYFAYARQDRKIHSRDPITAKLVSDLISSAGAQRILSVDLHADQIQGFFNIPVDNLTAASLLSQQFKAGDNLVIVSPDVGGVRRARVFAKKLDAPIAIVDKRRPKPNENEVMNIIGDVEGRHAVIFDDLIDTGGTIAKAAGALKEKGAASVRACATHGVFSGHAFEVLERSELDEVLVTDSIPDVPSAPAPAKVRRVSIAPLLADAIRRIHDGKSLSALFMDG